MLGIGLSLLRSPVRSLPWWYTSFPGAVFAADFVANRGMLNGGDRSPASLLVEGRSTPQIVENADGSLATVGPFEPPIGSKGLQIWEARTNKLRWSQGFETEDWTKTRLIIAPDISLTPDFTATAAKGIPTIESNDHFTEPAIGISPMAGNQETFSVFAKAAEMTRIGLYFSGGAFPSGERMAWFELADGMIGGAQSNIYADIASFREGWYRCTITRTMNTTSTIKSGFYATQGGFGDAFAGSSADGVLVWGAQYENRGSAGPYIPTENASATRAAGNLMTQDYDWWTDNGLNEGFFILLEADPVRLASASLRHLLHLPGIGSLYHAPNQSIGFDGAAANMATAPVPDAAIRRIGLRMTATGVRLTVTGLPAVQGTPAAMETLVASPAIGHKLAADHYNGNIRSLTIGPASGLSETALDAWVEAI